ncbi:MAG: HigA family addiction module antitoxin [Gammaproteobacteria bacterium]
MSNREYPVKGSQKMRPTHPGELLREDVLPALGVSVSEAARLLGVSRQTLHRLMAETIGVSADMALRLGKLCGNGPGLWLRMQAEYNLWQARGRLSSELRHIPTRRAVNE